MTSRRITLEHALYTLAFGLALFLRFLRLSALPLSDYEAIWALQALGITQGGHPALDSNPAYLLLTAASFFILGAGNFLARLWPALAGSALVLAPFFFRDRLSRIPALILAFALAIDPGLLALSRTAGSSILAVTFIILAWAMQRSGRTALAGLFGGLALLSGPAVWFGLVVFGLSRLVTRAPRPAMQDLKTTALWGLGVIIFGGTLFALVPNGLSALAASLPAYLRGWWTPSGIPAGLIMIALPGYALMPLVLGLIAAGRGWLETDQRSMNLSLWALAALLLVLLYPARQVGDLAWALIPLWALAGLELSRHLDFDKARPWELAGVAALTLAILAFSWLDLAGMAGLAFNNQIAQTRLLLLAGALLLLGLSLVMISVGWSPAAARLGGMWGLATALTVFTLGAATGAAGLRQPQTVELWPPSAPVAQADLLLQTAADLSGWREGHSAALSVSVAEVDSPALRWLFRDWPLPEGAASPALVITSRDTDLNLSVAYRGQDFTWRQSPAWDLFLSSDWSRWFVFHQAPTQDETIVLWARSDLFPDAVP